MDPALTGWLLAACGIALTGLIAAAAMRPGAVEPDPRPLPAVTPRRLIIEAALVAAAFLVTLALLGARHASAAEQGIASFYWHGRVTASGERFDPDGLTAAHRLLPFGTIVCVTDLATGRTVTVRINDRGPFVPGRIIDLSRGSARALGIERRGLARVTVEVLR